MNRFVAIAAVLTVAPVASAQNCDSYQKIIDAAAGGFASIKGPPIGPQSVPTAPLTGMFEAAVRVPYMASCRIFDFEDNTAYACTNILSFEGAIRGAYDNLLKDAHACLGSWAPADAAPATPPPAGFTTIEAHRLKGPDDLFYLLDLSTQVHAGRTYWRVSVLFGISRDVEAGA